MLSNKTSEKIIYILFIYFLVIEKNFCAQNFIHPGIMHKTADLDIVKSKIQTNQQPWKNAYDKFLTEKAEPYQNLTPKPYSSLEYVQHPYSVVECGSFNNPNVGCNDMVYDGMAAYSLALRYYLSNEKPYATKAIKIIKDWSDTYTKNTDSNSRLVVSWATPWFANAAEILRYTKGSGWTTTNTTEANNLFNKFKNHIFWEDRPANNWMMSSLEARLSIAVFQDDRTAFNDAIAKWKQRIKTYIYQTSDGSTPIPPAGLDAAFVERIWKDERASTDYVNGLCMETCRDINHTKLGFTSLMNAAEIAWSQGVDLFNLEKKRISDFLELHSNWMLGGAVPKNICEGRLDLISQEAFEIAYSHLKNRLGRNLPKTLEMLNKNRPNSANRWVTKWETMLYAERSFSTLNNNEIELIKNNFAIYPNPSDNGLFSLSEPKNWEVYNVVGVKILSGNGDKLELEKFTKGIYFVHVENNFYRIVLN